MLQEEEEEEVSGEEEVVVVEGVGVGLEGEEVFVEVEEVGVEGVVSRDSSDLKNFNTWTFFSDSDQPGKVRRSEQKIESVENTRTLHCIVNISTDGPVFCKWHSDGDMDLCRLSLSSCHRTYNKPVYSLFVCLFSLSPEVLIADCICPRTVT